VVERVSYFNTLLFPVVTLGRAWKRLVGDATHDLRRPAPVLNRGLEWLFALERHVVPRVGPALRRLVDAARAAMIGAVRGTGGERALVAMAFVALVTVAAVWLARDRRPPEWDHANHLERAVACAGDLARGDVRAILARSAF